MHIPQCVRRAASVLSVCMLLATAWLSNADANANAQADERDFRGIVTKVFDGDSFLVRPIAVSSRAALDGDNPPRRLPTDIDVRLLDIDAPEKDQPYANSARSALMKLIEGRIVFVDVIDIDRYQRKVARVYREPDRLEIARVLVQRGHVWVNRKFVRDATLVTLEDDARATRTGIWALTDEELVPPWEFRRRKKQR